MAISITQANSMIMNDDIEFEVNDRIVDYIRSYSSDIPLSEEWVEHKGHNVFYYYTGSTYATIFEFIGTSWNSFELFSYDQNHDMNQGFKYSSYQLTKGGKRRAFLPSGRPSFDSNGDTTEYFCEWVSEIILEVLEEFI